MSHPPRPQVPTPARITVLLRILNVFTTWNPLRAAPPPSHPLVPNLEMIFSFPHRSARVTQPALSIGPSVSGFYSPFSSSFRESGARGLIRTSHLGQGAQSSLSFRAWIRCVNCHHGKGKLLWFGLNHALIYGSLGAVSRLYLCNRIIVLGSPLGPMTYLATGVLRSENFLSFVV